ncbi:hypothetical protein C8J56DRAFT_903701 [Mycena floridula]|nr:hypothetical protein C8J56DRAFT_903701 [Mycena floridula]
MFKGQIQYNVFVKMDDGEYAEKCYRKGNVDLMLPKLQPPINLLAPLPNRPARAWADDLDPALERKPRTEPRLPCLDSRLYPADGGNPDDKGLNPEGHTVRSGCTGPSGLPPLRPLILQSGQTPQKHLIHPPRSFVDLGGRGCDSRHHHAHNLVVLRLDPDERKIQETQHPTESAVMQRSSSADSAPTESYDDAVTKPTANFDEAVKTQAENSVSEATSATSPCIQGWWDVEDTKTGFVEDRPAAGFADKRPNGLVVDRVGLEELKFETKLSFLSAPVDLKLVVPRQRRCPLTLRSHPSSPLTQHKTALYKSGM